MPTVLYLNYLPIPEYVDGTALTPIAQQFFEDEGQWNTPMSVNLSTHNPLSRAQKSKA
jgi:hypothetical protein